MEPTASCKDMLYAPVLGMDETVETQLSPRKISMPRSTSEALALLPETSVFSEWPVLFLNVGVGGRGSGTQKEVTANQVFTVPFPCPQSIFHYLEKFMKAPKGNQPPDALGRALRSQGMEP